MRVTKDEIAVLSYDFVIILSHGFQKIQDLHYDDLAKNGVELVRLDEAVEVIYNSNKTANLDLKSGTVLEAMARTIRDMGMMDSVLLTGLQKRIHKRNS